MRLMAATVLGLGFALCINLSCDTTEPADDGHSVVDTVGNFDHNPDFPIVCESGNDLTDNVTIHMHYPSGGEVFHPGDTVLPHLCAEDTSEIRLYDIVWFINFEGRIESTQLGDYDVLFDEEQGHYVWVVPDTVRVLDLYGAVTMTPMDNVKCRLRAEEYNNYANFAYTGFVTVKQK